LHDDGNIVDGLLHLLVIAFVGLGDHFIDLAAGDLAEDAVAFADWQRPSLDASTSRMISSDTSCISRSPDFCLLLARSGRTPCPFPPLPALRVLLLSIRTLVVMNSPL
jgi:hypothetical protein